MQDALEGTRVQAFQTIVVNLPELSDPDRVMTIASIISQSTTKDCVLAFISNVEPRRELADPEERKGGMRLISALAKGGQCVTVVFSSSDMVLWKAAGATNCATGKFFNLRRFTLSRLIEDSSGGGGQLGYWFEESLLAFLRQSDLLRVQSRGMISLASKSNPFCDQILAAIPAKKEDRRFRHLQNAAFRRHLEAGPRCGGGGSRENIEHEMHWFGDALQAQ